MAAQGIRRRPPQIGVLVLSHHLEAHYAMRLLDEVPERAGYLLKERVSDVAVLADALRRIGEANAWSTPRSSRGSSPANARAARSTS